MDHAIYVSKSGCLTNMQWEVFWFFSVEVRCCYAVLRKLA